MHECRCIFQRLDQVGFDRVLEQQRQRAGHLEVGHRHRPVVIGVGDNDPINPGLHVFQIGGQAQNRHQFRGDRDVKAAFTRNPVRFAAQTQHDTAQGAFIQVHHPPPSDSTRINRQFIAMMDMVVDHRRQQIVGAGHGVDVAGEMQVDVFHRHDLGVAAACRAAFDAETGAQRRLPQGYDDFFAQPSQRIANADRVGRFSFTGRRRIDRADQNQFSVRPVF